MWTLVVPVIGQHLSKVEVVIWPDGVEVADTISIDKRTLVLTLRYGTVSIAEVTITIAVLHITAIKIYTLNTR